MSLTVRVSLPGYNCLTETDLDNYALFADENNLLIKEQSRGGFSVSAETTTAIAHNLGYIPYAIVFADLGSKRYFLYGFIDPAIDTYFYVDLNHLRIKNNGMSTVTGNYFIFYDLQT